MKTRTNQAVWSDEKQQWRIDVQSDGKRRSFYSSTPGRKGMSECHRKADMWLEQATAGENTPVSTLYDEYLESIKKSTSKSNWMPIDSHWRNWFKDYIGHKKIGKLNEQDIQDRIDAAYKAGLSKKTLMNMRNFMSSFIRFCRKKKATTLTLDEVSIPKGATKKKKKILQPDEIKVVFSSIRTTFNRKEADDWYIHAYRFFLATGLRPGELIGLEEAKIRGTRITIDKSINALDEETDGKNENACRTFCLSKLAASVIVEQKAMLKRAAVISPYMFPARDGGPVDGEALCGALQRYCRYNKITQVTPYELRHTFVSALKDVPDALLKQQVGHSENMDTQGTYGHEVAGDMERMASMVDSVMGKIIAQK